MAQWSLKYQRKGSIKEKVLRKRSEREVQRRSFSDTAVV